MCSYVFLAIAPQQWVDKIYCILKSVPLYVCLGQKNEVSPSEEEPKNTVKRGMLHTGVPSLEFTADLAMLNYLTTSGLHMANVMLVYSHGALQGKAAGLVAT
ncbi:hypothetical protein FKM82_016231 [Ascaphus truei]